MLVWGGERGKVGGSLFLVKLNICSCDKLFWKNLNVIDKDIHKLCVLMSWRGSRLKQHLYCFNNIPLFWNASKRRRSVVGDLANWAHILKVWSFMVRYYSASLLLNTFFKSPLNFHGLEECSIFQIALKGGRIFLWSDFFIGLWAPKEECLRPFEPF